MSILSFAALIKTVADRYGYDAALLAAQAQQESAGNPSAKSPAGALGLMQFMPATWGDYGRGADPFDPEASLDAVRTVLQAQIDTLRRRGISWSLIGDALGVSRQAAWERFS